MWTWLIGSHYLYSMVYPPVNWYLDGEASSGLGLTFCQGHIIDDASVLPLASHPKMQNVQLQLFFFSPFGNIDQCLQVFKFIYHNIYLHFYLMILEVIDDIFYYFFVFYKCYILIISLTNRILLQRRHSLISFLLLKVQLTQKIQHKCMLVFVSCILSSQKPLQVNICDFLSRIQQFFKDCLISERQYHSVSFVYVLLQI